MASARTNNSDNNQVPNRTDILNLADEFEIDPDGLERALVSAYQLLSASREIPRMANKKSLKGIEKSLSKIVDRLSDEAVKERLLQAHLEAASSDGNDELKKYEVWWEAGATVDQAIDGVRGLRELIRASERLNAPAGRPPYEELAAPITSLLDFWNDDLRREVTVSGHADDPRAPKPSQTLSFVCGCIQALGENVTEQACRTVIQGLKDPRNRLWARYETD